MESWATRPSIESQAGRHVRAEDSGPCTAALCELRADPGRRTLSQGGMVGEPRDPTEVGSCSRCIRRGRRRGSMQWRRCERMTESASDADGGSSGQSLEGFGVGGGGDATLGENCLDVAIWSDVEGRVSRLYIRGYAHALKVRDFSRGAFFDGDVLAVWNR